MKHILILITCLYSINVFSQENIDKSGMNWGINMGMYWGNSKDALFYNASTSRPYSLEDVVYSINTREVLTVLLNDNYTLQAPSIMRYKPAVVVGLNLQYYTSKKLAYFLNVNILKQEAYGIFKLILASPPTDPTKYTNTVDGYVNASEKRFNIEAGMHLLIESVTGKYTPYVDLGFSASILQTDEHTMSVKTYSTSIAYTGLYEGNHLYNAFGYGPLLGAGIQFPLSSKYYVFTGVTAELLQYNLFNSGYALNKSIIARVMF